MTPNVRRRRVRACVNLRGSSFLRHSGVLPLELQRRPGEEEPATLSVASLGFLSSLQSLSAPTAPLPKSRRAAGTGAAAAAAAPAHPPPPPHLLLLLRISSKKKPNKKTEQAGDTKHASAAAWYPPLLP